MEKRFAQFVSIVLHPLILPLIGLLILFNSGTYTSLMSFSAKKILFLMIGTGSFLFPVTLLLFMSYRKLISDFPISDRKERFLPMTLVFLLFLFTFFLIYRLPVNRLIHGYLLAICISLLLSIFANVFIKVSLHMVALGGISGLIFSLFRLFGVSVQLFFVLSVLAAGLAGYAMLKLERHSEKEIYSGYLLGFAVLMVVMGLYV